MMATSERPPRLKSLAEVKREHIQLVLQETGGNKTAAAKILGIDRRTLDRLGIRRSRKVT